MLPWGILAASGSGAAGAMELISTTILSTTSTSVTFSSIPATYKHLQIRATTRTDRSGIHVASVIASCNSDMSSNYSYHQLYGTGSAVGSYGLANTTGYIATATAATQTGSVFTSLISTLLDYANTTNYKTFRTLHGFTGSAGHNIELSSTNWRNTAAVSTLTLTAGSGSNFIAGSRFSLYGIKGA